jgi:hypothetical protein
LELAMSVAQPKFDGDLAKGILREDAFARILLGGRELWEHKRDFKCIETNNLAIEYETSELPRGQGRRWPSGISKTASHWYVLEFAHDRRLVMPTDFVKDVARSAIRSGRHVWGGDNRRFHNALVPVDWFLYGPVHEIRVAA